ncbi:MAG: LytTR family transcriptional regulator DNA-binding domain-containing protein [Bacteroidales bacterium]|nr:LytTR family transcriptional regulator DNA-binding domain-containing protein [Bacteroidales bacterium]
MRIAGRILYWLAAVTLVAAILSSLDYSPAQAMLVGLIFCPCSLALEYWMPKARKPMDKVYLSLAVLVSVILVILLLHYSVWVTLTQEGYSRPERDVAPMLVNPAFLGLVLTALAIGDYFWSKWLAARFQAKGKSVTFFSERKSVTLPVADIAYVESNDTEVRIVTVSGDAYRNKTGITQWENLLGEGFLRIHRSFLVNASMASLTSPDTLSVLDKTLPVSRKYKESVKAAFPSLEVPNGHGL